jgi:hypothetical protein
VIHVTIQYRKRTFHADVRERSKEMVVGIPMEKGRRQGSEPREARS